MKAYVLYGINDLRYVDIEKPQCPDGWAIVKVKAAGICSSDISRIFTKGTYHFPTIPGHEFAGIVESVGNSNDSFLIGKKVGIFPLIPCRTCSQCENKHYEMCENYDYIGSRRDGGFAEYVSVPVWNLVPFPDNIPFSLAAMLEPLSVAFHAIKLGNIQNGQTVGIIGTGMIGISAGQWAKKLGADKVTIIGRNEEKRKLVENVGLNYINHNNTNQLDLFDIVLEAVGTPSSIELSINSTNPGGNIIFMGNPASNIALNQNTYWRILRKQLTIKGTWNSSYDGINSSDWTEVIKAITKQEINIIPLISHCFHQSNLMEGLELMRSHRESYCKVMTVWNE